MTIIEALILGIIQGLTEFLPISSSGHLVVAQKLAGLSDVLLDKAIIFDLTLHLGTVVAVIYCYRDDVRMLLKNLAFWRPADGVEEHKSGRKILLLLIVSLIGTAIIAFPFKHFFEAAFNSLTMVAIGFFITAVVLLFSKLSKGNRNLDEMSFGKALVIGIAQGIAAMPGISRSGITIVVCMLLGFSGKESARYSFILAIPTIILASLVELKDAFKVGSIDLPATNYIIGFIVAAIFGVIAIKSLLKVLEKKGLAWFSIYCFVIAVVTLALVSKR